MSTQAIIEELKNLRYCISKDSSVNSTDINQAIAVAKSTYGDDVSIQDKSKNLLKFGTHTSVGTGWETLAEWQDSEIQETFVTDNGITTVVSDNAGDTEDVVLEYHTLNYKGDAIFGVQTVTLQGLTPVPLDVPCFRANRAYNSSNTLLQGNVAFYEGGAITSGKPNDDDQVHLLIVAGEQQSQKAATTISAFDYWFIANVSLSVTEKTSSWAEARLEIKPIDSIVWKPVTQNFASSDASGTVEIIKQPYIIVPKNHDVRLSVRTNTAGVSVSGGFSGYLASIK